MSLDTVVEDIRDEARARADEIRSEGEERAEEIIDEAEREADDIVDEAEREAERKISQERDQKLSSAKLEAKQARLEARREVLEEVHDDVEAQIADIDGDEREALTRSLLDAAAEEFDGDSVRVHGHEDDADLLEGIVADYDGFEVGEPVDCLGGVVVESDASRVRVNNTFDSILEDVWEENLREISARLFEE
ncbi:A-type ATP synthase subunit E [Natronomonas pharaonis DSM 2160]|uniref:A-type ATP synthase subunit E n=1 Tax=Natronomonas pharaonis (strain ATCC 35678 / DSM 2160 / CIP 103997 / JCM 8858 / NBRC 14720 / NCIMB 2260 / Gabara) TaxID=348780 RepID=AATE_NATPD|nr:V-type ATP synthase subunit E [Natronomonas pharaonis]Q3ITD1.1 RecName: Full=V-type ATP synthase subunit E; AltName: Full=V-ATPase subunit E [Natronomonas pharaonis DSM 2160]CAI48603.1 A-type ATP synthase subunit E [Natronomonas pharaonis DSM 2160]